MTARSDEPRTSTRVGQSAVEFALVLPILMLITVMAIDFGRAFFSYIQITNAAREAAAFGAASPTDETGMEGRARQETNAQSQAGEDDIELTFVCSDPGGQAIDCEDATGGTGAGNTITVTVTEPFSFLTPFANGFFNNDFQMRVSATAIVLGYVPSVGTAGGVTCPPPIASFDVVANETLEIYANPAASQPNSAGNPCNISGYNWLWGDGEDAVGDATGSYHTYSSSGLYTITLEVTNQGGAHTTTRQVTVPADPDASEDPDPSEDPEPVECDPPDAGFTFTTSGSGSNKTWTYVDTSTVSDETNCPLITWLWTFHDMPPGQRASNAQFPASFAYGGNPNAKHSVTLEVTNAGGRDSITKDTP